MRLYLLLALTTLALWLPAPVAAFHNDRCEEPPGLCWQCIEEPASPLDGADFFEAKAAACGELDAALTNQACALTRHNLRVFVQQPLERWRADHCGAYPAMISELFAGDPPYTRPGFCANPFTACCAAEMNTVALVENDGAWTQQAPGNFSYLPSFDNLGRAVAYELRCFGPASTSGIDVDNDGVADGVLEIVHSGLPTLSREEFYAAKAAAGGALDAGLISAAESIAVQNLYLSVQKPLESWIINSYDISYPHQIDELLQGQDRYAKPGFCANPFFSSSDMELNTEFLPPGWTKKAPGNFSYLPVTDASGAVASYELWAYGADGRAGFDVDGDGRGDGVIAILRTGFDNLTYGDFFAAKHAAGGRLNKKLSRQAEVIAQQNLRKIQRALAQWAVDHEGLYPQHINQLSLGAAPYLPAGFYANPFTAQMYAEHNTAEVPLGWTAGAPGNFSYLQYYDEAGDVTGYLLLAYGASRASGQDVDGDGRSDGVISVLASSPDLLPASPATFYSGGRRLTLTMSRQGGN